METICNLNIINLDASMYQELWDYIIIPQKFYLEDVYYELYGEMYPHIRPSNYEEKNKDPKWLINIYGKRQKIPSGKVLKNEINEIVGFMYWKESKKECYLKFFILRQDYQNKGIGGEWMSWLIHHFEYKIIGLSFNYYNNGLKNFMIVLDLMTTELKMNLQENKYQFIGLINIKRTKQKKHFLKDLSINCSFCLGNIILYCTMKNV